MGCEAGRASAWAGGACRTLSARSARSQPLQDTASRSQPVPWGPGGAGAAVLAWRGMVVPPPCRAVGCCVHPAASLLPPMAGSCQRRQPRLGRAIDGQTLRRTRLVRNVWRGPFWCCASVSRALLRRRADNFCSSRSFLSRPPTRARECTGKGEARRWVRRARERRRRGEERDVPHRHDSAPAPARLEPDGGYIRPGGPSAGQRYRQ